MGTLLLVDPAPSSAGMLSANLAIVPQGSDINLTSLGSVDWVHWGLFTESSVNRKANVLPQISNFTLLDSSNGFAYVYQYADNFNGYSWTDGEPVAAVNDTRTGVWAYGVPQIGSGFRFTVPADAQPKILKVFVGAYAARGLFRASLSDGSASPYSNNAVSNTRNGEGGVYTLEFAANSPDQTLTVTYTLEMPRAPDGNVTLQAATLSVPGGNNPPVVFITNPTADANFAEPANVLIEATANDVDGAVTNVEFYADGVQIGEAGGSPFRYSWNEVPVGRHVLSAVATDDGGARTPSRSVEIFVYGAGGSLTGTTVLPPLSVDLTTEGETDWIHWGLSSSNLVNRKAGIDPQISPLLVLGTNTIHPYEDNFTAFSWSDGDPTVSALNQTRGVYLNGNMNGYQIVAPADATPRRLRVYVGLYGGMARMRAYLSDFSAMAYTDQSLSNFYGNSYAVYTFDYAAASPGQSLIVQYQTEQLFDLAFGNITIQAATLLGGSAPSNAPPTVQITLPSEGSVYFSPADITMEATAADSDGSIFKVEFYQNSILVGEANSFPYRYDWTDVPAGDYTLTARAIDNRGATTVSAPVNMVVRHPPLPVTLVQPVREESHFRFSFLSQSNQSYAVEWTRSLHPSDWQILTNLQGTGQILGVTNQTEANLGGFYRVLSE